MGLEKFQDVTTILFDLDNTLINTRGADRIACEQVAKYLHNSGIRRSVARDAVEKFYIYVRETPHDPNDENGDVDAWRLLLWRQALGAALSGHAPAAYSLWKDARATHLRLQRDTEDLLLELRRRFKLGIVTNGPSCSQWEKIRRINGSAFFDAIVVSGDVRHTKPHPSIFEEAFRLLDCSALECAMVGDKLETDIEGASRANCAVTVLFQSDSEGSDGDMSSVKPDYKISHLRELLDLIPEKKGFSFLCQDRTLGVFHSLRDDIWKA